MTSPPLPPYPPSQWGMTPADPGRVPLRPLTVGDVLAAGLGVVRRHFALLGPLAVLVSALASAASVGILSGTGTLDEFVSAQWVEDVLSGRRTTLPRGIYWAAASSVIISIVGAVLLSGIATACAAADATAMKPAPGAVRGRLRGQWAGLVATGLIVGVGTSIGLALLVIPGVLIYLAWVMAAPASVMERAKPSTALARSTRLTRGHRWRILGITVLIVVIAYVIEVVVSSAVGAVVEVASPLSALIVSDIAGAVIASVTLSWVAAVAAVIYIDLRIRKENLASALRAYAAGQG